MNCWHCNTELIWGGDQDLEEEDPYMHHWNHSMVTNLSCPECNAFVEVYV
jgi:hypothetical protein